MTETTHFTLKEIASMGDQAYADAATKNLHYTTVYSSPFLDSSVIDRTAHSLLERIWRVNRALDSQAEDPNVPAEAFARTKRFRSMLLSSFDLVERRMSWQSGHHKTISQWKATVHEMINEIEGTTLDWLLDDFVIPFPQGDLPLRTFVEIRRAKGKTGLPKKEMVAA